MAEFQLQEHELQSHQNKRVSELEQEIFKYQCICKYESLTDGENLERQVTEREESRT